VIVNKFGLILASRRAGLVRLEEMRIQFDGSRLRNKIVVVVCPMAQPKIVSRRGTPSNLTQLSCRRE
jgi:hypothetical protein